MSFGLCAKCESREAIGLFFDAALCEVCLRELFESSPPPVHEIIERFELGALLSLLDDADEHPDDPEHRKGAEALRAILVDAGFGLPDALPPDSE